MLIGTAHISRESADLVREVIVAEQPDCVCIELDEQRFKALSQEERFESLDLREVIRQRQLTTLMMNLMLASYQRQLGGRLGVMPGSIDERRMTHRRRGVTAGEEDGDDVVAIGAGPRLDQRQRVDVVHLRRVTSGAF